MFGIGTGELLMLLVIALIVLGPERMPQLARDIGRTLGDLRRTSDDLRTEFLNADKMLEAAAKQNPPAVEAPATAADVGTTLTPSEPSAGPLPRAGAPTPGPEGQAPDAGAHARAAPSLTGAPAPEAEAATPAEPEAPAPEPAETDFDREARLAREKLDDPERKEQARLEGWTVPTDDAGTAAREG